MMNGLSSYSFQCDISRYDAWYDSMCQINSAYDDKILRVPRICFVLNKIPNLFCNATSA